MEYVVCTKWRGQRWWHGFYGPKIFRPTLLAKQGRWILDNTNTLLNRIWMLSTLHRIDSSCMEAQLKPNASYVWKSMLEAQDIISQRFEMETWEKKINKNIGGLRDTNTEKPTTYRVGSPTISFVTKSPCQCPNRWSNKDVEIRSSWTPYHT